jgi:hypothetical protein
LDITDHDGRCEIKILCLRWWLMRRFTLGIFVNRKGKSFRRKRAGAKNVAFGCRGRSGRSASTEQWLRVRWPKGTPFHEDDSLIPVCLTFCQSFRGEVKLKRCGWLSDYRSSWLFARGVKFVRTIMNFPWK